MCAMNHGDNVNMVRLHVVDNSIGAFDDFSYLGKIDFWNGTTGLGKGTDLLGSSGEPVNDF